MNITVENLWVTPVLRTNIADSVFIEQLLHHILADPDAASSNAASATRDKIDVAIANRDPLFVKAEQCIRQHVDAYFKQVHNLESVNYKLEMFYLLHSQGRHVKYHNHKGSTLTGVLYVNTPSGNLTLLDPRVNANRHVLKQVLDTGHFDPVEIAPTAGELIIFPSYVYHFGTPNMSPAPRIVLVFDVI